MRDILICNNSPWVHRSCTKMNKVPKMDGWISNMGLDPHVLVLATEVCNS